MTLLAVAMAAAPNTTRSSGASRSTGIRTLRVGPASVGASVSPAFVADGQGAVYFFGGNCGGKPESCWCDVLRQRPGQRLPAVIAGHVPGGNPRPRTPAQRLNLSGCDAVAVDEKGIVELFAFDRGIGRYGSKGIFRIDPMTGGYQEQHDCLGCDDSRIAGLVSKVSFYGVHSAAFDAAGNVYLANDEHHVIQKLAPHGVVSVVMRPHCRTQYISGPLVEISDCLECSNSAVTQNDDVFDCPEWPAIGPGGRIYYVDEDDNTVRMIDQRGHEHLVAGGGSCRIWRLRLCGTRVRATRLWLRDRSTDGPRSLALDAKGNLYIALWSYLLQVTPSNVVHVLAGNGQVLLTALHWVYSPRIPATREPTTAEAVTVDPHGHVYFLDDTGAIREIVQ